MKKLKKNYKIFRYIFFNIAFFFLFFNSVKADNISFEIQGNKYTDTNAILSILDDIPQNLNSQSSNDIINALNESNLFSDVVVKFNNNKYTIIVKEFSNIDNIFFRNNERLDDDELLLLADQSNLKTFNDQSINIFINELKKLYESYGYNDVIIDYNEKIYSDLNTVDLYFNIKEGKITKINKIIIDGNNSTSSQNLKEIIVSKTKSFRNIFANNNFKQINVQRDKILISNFYKNLGFLDIQVNEKIEFLNTNKVNIYYVLDEGDIYNISSINLNDDTKIINDNTTKIINQKIRDFLDTQNNFSLSNIEQFENEISNLILESGVEFFEINILQKINNKNIEILFQILPIKPMYTNQINIIGNYRTYDYVIRRELEISEGDAVYKTQIQKIRNKLLSLNLFETVEINEENIDENLINLEIEVEEKQTGTFNAGVSIGTLDGFAIVTGLRERNFYGTGRSLDILLNTSEDKNQFKLITTDRLSYENDADISYSINYKQQDFSNASSYKLDSFKSGIGIGYRINKNLFHNIDLEYLLKDYKITNSSTVSESIASSAGANISYLITNNLRYSTLNPGFVSKKGNFINYNNAIETPTSSKNGFVRNVLTIKNYYSSNKSIFSIQTKIGNIFSLNNNDILTDDKFALGGRWLRGFDSYGAGPRNSRTSYVGANNVAVTKFDYSYEITRKSNFPLYLNLFNDYGLLWENKTTPTQSDNSLRSSAGFGIKYYSPIGPIGFTWGFPIMDEEYDIKRMFLFSIGNID